LDMLDQSLARLPPADRPSWSIREQLLVTDPKESRLNEADLSQPLCTAIQIALVDLLQSVGVSFGAVLGHSSGEIAAAYVSGFINASDAIRVAYYRGLCAKRASTQRVIPGAMMAVGTTFEDAEELCQIPELEGRICIAASNSEESITISGDADAIDEAKSILDDEKKFARKLKVDTAYHSHHMQICAEPYVKALEDCDIQIQKGRSDCIWFSSVDDGAIVVSSYKLRSQYWKENMVRPVMFSQALTSALLECTSFDAIVELGPHPALQGPASQTVQSVCDKKIPYTGLLKRNQNDTESLLAGLGFVWAHCGKSSIDIAALDRIIDPSFVEPTLLKNLPSYPWDHTKSYWTESRISKAFDSRSEPIHGLLGVRISDADGEIRFKNCLQIRELPWVTGHQLQGQAVFPAAAYIVAVLESARHLVKGRQIKLLEIQDMSIGRAIILDEGNESGIETLLTLTTAVGEDDDVNTFNADFRFSSAGSADSESLALNASGRLQVICGKPAADTLPERERSPPNMVEVEEDLFYSNLTEVGYQYSGPFRALSSLKRSLGRANGLVTHMPEEGAGGEYLVHPSMLDAAIQSILLAFQWPGDGSLRELHVPTSIDRLRVNPFFCLADDTRTISFPFESATAERRTALIRGDVDIFPEIGFNSAIQLEGLTVKPFVAATAATDRRIFSTWRWNVAWPDAEVAVGGDRPSDHDKLVASATEQAAVYYLKNLKKVVSKEEFEKSAWHHQHLLAFADHVLDGVANGSLPFGQKKWLDTTKEQLYDDIIPSIGDSIEMRLVRAVGENLPDAVRGKTQILEHMLQDNLLNDFYVQGRGIQEHTRFLANMVDQIVHRYSDMNILEIGE
jgi:hybrid polyketide synthase/nonribosomal peptide synthetase ACE1